MEMNDGKEGGESRQETRRNAKKIIEINRTIKMKKREEQKEGNEGGGKICSVRVSKCQVSNCVLCYLSIIFTARQFFS